MGLFDRKEVVFLKESNAAEEQLKKLEDLRDHYALEPDDMERLQKDILLVKAGIAGENNIIYELKNADMNLVVLHDLCLKTSDGRTAQIDFFIITSKFRVLLECKNLYGNITIDNKGQFIRTISLVKRYWKEGIYSPVEQNEKHMRIYNDVMQETIKSSFGRFNNRLFFNNWNKAYVVLANPRTYLNDRYAPKEIKSKVLRADQLVPALKKLNASSGDLPFSLKEMKEIGEGMLKRNTEERTDYAAKYNAAEKKEEAPVIQEAPEEKLCPRCGRPLVLRTAAKGKHAGEKFYGCSGFPHCRYVEKYEEQHLL